MLLLDANHNNRLNWISILRGALQQTLLDELPKSNNNDDDAATGVTVRFGKKLTRIVQQDCGCYSCNFADGSTEEDYDLIVGAEGINSVAKQYVENPKKQQQQRDASSNDAGSNSKSSSSIYSGIRIRYAVADGDESASSSTTTATLRQHFGNGAYALSGVYGAGPGRPHAKCAFIVYLDDDYIGSFPRKRKERETPATVISENADWSQDNRQSVETARHDMLEQLKAAGISTRTEVADYIRSADRFFELGSYFHNPFGRWSNGGVVLCGDAAHAMPPFLGQGSNQAIQDAYCLVEKIVAYNAAVENGSLDGKTLQDYFDEYEKIRWPSTFSVFWKAAFLGYLETGGVNGFYSKFRDVFFKTMGIIGVAERVLISAATPKM